MAGHSKFKNIMYRKGAQDKKKAKVFTKLIKEITVAVKMGGDDMNSNPRLRSAILEARANNMPKENVERAIKKGTSSDTNDNYFEVRYEGYLVAGVVAIVETLTDNKNRTAGEVRTVFSKNGGNLGETGSVNFLFDHVGIIKFNNADVDFESLFEIATDLGALDVEEDEDELSVITSIEDLHTTSSKLSENIGKDYISASLNWVPKVLIDIDDEEKAKQIIKTISLLEDLDDVQNVFANFNIKEELLDKIDF